MPVDKSSVRPEIVTNTGSESETGTSSRSLSKKSFSDKMIDPRGQRVVSRAPSIDSHGRRSAKPEIDHHGIGRGSAAELHETIILSHGRRVGRKLRQAPIRSVQIRLRRNIQNGNSDGVQIGQRLLHLRFIFVPAAQPGRGKFAGNSFEFRGGIAAALRRQPRSKRVGTENDKADNKCGPLTVTGRAAGRIFRLAMKK